MMGHYINFSKILGHTDKNLGTTCLMEARGTALRLANMIVIVFFSRRCAMYVY